jgi:hypothetical protein
MVIFAKIENMILNLIILDFRFTPELNSGSDLLLTTDVIAHACVSNSSISGNDKTLIFNSSLSSNDKTLIFNSSLSRKIWRI